MIGGISLDAKLLLFFLRVLVLQYCESSHDVTYDGRHFVPEGSPFTITCEKSSHGLPKWTKNGLAVDSEYRTDEQQLQDDRMLMVLSVAHARWNHRGHYKCDPLSVQSHWIEIVPSKESDQEIQQQTKVQLKPNNTLKLACDQEENAVFPINWYKDGVRVLASGETGDRVRMTGRTLWVARSGQSDSGEYMCVIEMAGLSYPFADHLGSRIKVTDPASSVFRFSELHFVLEMFDKALKEWTVLRKFNIMHYKFGLSWDV
ncbi:hypothetical protein JTE90_016630 [Oedothorax gibbosus]|uniref:Ig-like domain-containing protein n=1 Tax=Oedothorax gibbosus TaxID=931172 RepID=A0AAV6U3W0_9ARAC|nr:hypothetical protein JTE90_016630 [Oedothorax gibbosus]